MLNVRIRIGRETVKAFGDILRQAYRAGDVQLVKRVTALLRLRRQESAASIAAELGCAESSIYLWLKKLVYEGIAGLKVTWRGERPNRLTKTQKAQLVELIKAGPQAAGFKRGGWNAAMIQTLIEREFGVLYNVHYVAELLHNLGFSFQKARFVSDHLDALKRLAWLERGWPTFLAQAKAAGGLLLFEGGANRQRG